MRTKEVRKPRNLDELLMSKVREVTARFEKAGKLKSGRFVYGKYYGDLYIYRGPGDYIVFRGSAGGIRTAYPPDVDHQHRYIDLKPKEKKAYIEEMQKWLDAEMVQVAIVYREIYIPADRPILGSIYLAKREKRKVKCLHVWNKGDSPFSIIISDGQITIVPVDNQEGSVKVLEYIDADEDLIDAVLDTAMKQSEIYEKIKKVLS
jgi:hypothetical protein